MSTATNTGLIIDEVTPLLERVNNAATAKGLALVGARAMGTLVRAHLVGLNGQRHRSGGTNFYARAARSVTSAIVPQGAATSITAIGFRQRLLGGTIRPRAGKKYLTIPAREEAYGVRAPEFQDLHFALVETQDGNLRPALVRNWSTAISIHKRKQSDGSFKTSIKAGEAQGGEVMYWLVRKVTQQADPSVLPYNEQLVAVAVTAIEKEMLRLARGSGGGN